MHNSQKLKLIGIAALASAVVSLSLLTVTPKVKASFVTGPTALDATSVTTAGTAVTAIKASSLYNGCWIQNDWNATTSIIIDAVGTANHTTPSSTASSVPPGGVWNCPGASVVAVTIDSSDNTHKFYGVKY